MKVNELSLPLFLIGLKDEGVEAICFSFNGCGDSGDIDQFAALNAGALAENGGLLYHLYTDEIDEYIVDVPNLDDYQDQLWDLIYSPVHAQDWWNNEGGDGYAVLNIHTMQCFVQHYINYTRQESSSSTTQITLEG